MMFFTARSHKHLLSAATVVVFLGCDQVKDITSGGGTKDVEPTQTSTGTISAQSSDSSQESQSGDESSLKTWAEVLAEAGIEEEPVPDADVQGETPEPPLLPGLPELVRGDRQKPRARGGQLAVEGTVALVVDPGAGFVIGLCQGWPPGGD